MHLNKHLYFVLYLFVAFALNTHGLKYNSLSYGLLWPPMHPTSLLHLLITLNLPVG